MSIAFREFSVDVYKRQDYSVEEIPADLVDEANEWRDKMLEKVAEFDDTLMAVSYTHLDVYKRQII